MDCSAIDMLRKLASGVVPDSSTATAAGAANGAAPGGVGFAEMLAKLRSTSVQTGTIQSGLGVTIDERLGLKLTGEQQLRLSRAIDAAQADGLTTAAVAIDGITLLVDVDGRRVTGVVKAGERPATGVDGIVTAAPAEIPEQAPQAVAGNKANAAGSAAAQPAAIAAVATAGESSLASFSVPSSLLLAKLSSMASAARPQPAQSQTV